MDRIASTKERGRTGKMNMVKIFSDFRLGNGSGTCGNPVCSGRVVGDNEFGEPGVGEGLGIFTRKSLLTQERRGKEDLERP